MGYGRIWSFAVRIISAPITPMKSAPCGPNWSFAKFQGSWFSGGGNRSGSGGSGCAAALINPPRDGIAGIPIAPVCLGLLDGAPSGNPDFPQARCRPPTRGFGRNHRRQIVHGLFRASGIVMISSSSSRFGRSGTSAVSSECLGHFWRAEVGNFSRAPKGRNSQNGADRALAAWMNRM